MTPEPALPAVTPEPVLPAVPHEPVLPAVTAEAVLPAVTPGPVAPAPTPDPVAPARTAEPVVAQFAGDPVISGSAPPADAGVVAMIRPAPVLNLANALTALRIVLVPVFVLITVASQMTHPGLRVAACVIFSVASLTDFVDGWIARAYGLVTSFGKVADPIADKALTGSALILLSYYDRLPWWVTVVILAREIGVTLLRFWVIRVGVIPASRGGKVKTTLQSLAIGWYLAPFPHALAVIGPWLMAAALIVTVVTGADYVLRAVRLRRTTRVGG
jgi:CDP-diacylglycerol--glycerol-3-phosphate 3-phosphatidyltransferase